MTKNDRFKTYTQLEKISQRMLSRSLPHHDEIQKLQTEFREILFALAGDTLLKNCSSDTRLFVRCYPVGG